MAHFETFHQAILEAAAPAYRALLDDIVSLALAPGARLDATELSQQYALPLAPVHAALLRLAGDGLVDICGGAPACVRAIDIDAVRRVQFLRVAVEVEIVTRLAASEVGGLVERMRALIALQRDCAGRNERCGFMRAAQLLAKQLYLAVDATDLWDMVRARSAHADRLTRLRLRTPGVAERLIGAQAELIEAIGLHDTARATHAVRRHLSLLPSDIDTLSTLHPGTIVMGGTSARH